MTSEQLDRWESEIRQRDHGTTHWDGCEESHPRCRELALIARVRELEAERDEWRALTITPRGAQYYIDKAAQAEAERDRLAAENERLKAGFVVDGETSDGYHTFNELYAYRKALHALLANEWARRGVYDVHKSWYHSDGEPCFGGGWFIVVAELPEGQVSNHYKAADWALFQVPERERGNTYDGHTPAIALERLLARAARAEAPTPAREEGQ